MILQLEQTAKRLELHKADDFGVAAKLSALGGMLTNSPWRSHVRKPDQVLS